MMTGAATNFSLLQRTVGALALVGFAGLGVPAAAELDADMIRADFQGVLDRYVAQAQGTLQPQGEVKTVVEGDAVLATFPAIAIVADGRRLDIPEIVVRLDEISEDRVAYTADLPAEITGERGPPAPDTLTLTIGEREVVGIYRPSLSVSENFRVRLGAIELVTGDGGFEIGSFTIGSESVEKGPKAWDASGGFEIGEFRAFGPDKATVVEIARIGLDSSFDQFDLPTYMELYTKFSAAVTADPSSEHSPEAKAAMLDMTRRMPAAFKGASGGGVISIEGLAVAAMGGPPFNLGAASFEIGAAPEDPFYGIDIELNVAEPDVDMGPMPGVAELVPESVFAAISLRQLPFAQLWDMVSGPLEQELQGDPSGKAADELEMAPMMAMGVAAEAGSFAEIRGIEFNIGPARFTATGVGPLVPGLPEPALRIEGEIAGLEALIEDLQALAPEMQEQATPIALMLRGLGKAEARNDEIVYTYLIEQGPNGPDDIVINGVSLDQIGAPK